MKCLCLVALLLCAPWLTAQRVGASLALEGRAALLRAADFLLMQQQASGAWQDDVSLTAVACLALHSAEPALSRECLQAVQRAQAWLKQKTHADDLRQQWQAAPAATPPSPSQLLVQLEVSAARGHAVNLPPMETWSPAFRLAAQLLVSDRRDEAQLRLLYAAARHLDWLETTAAEHYWAARAFTACQRLRLVAYDHWQADLLSSLLDRQLGDGSWQMSGAPLEDTALNLLALVLCLRE